MCGSDVPNATEEMTLQELELTGLNSAISPLAVRARREIALRNKEDDRPRIDRYDLTPQNKRDIKKQSLKEIADVMSFFFLSKGCQHLRGACYLTFGELDGADSIGSTGEPCDKCPICCKERHQMHLPVYRDQIVRFFQSSTGRSVLPMPVSYHLNISLTSV